MAKTPASTLSGQTLPLPQLHPFSSLAKEWPIPSPLTLWRTVMVTARMAMLLAVLELPARPILSSHSVWSGIADDHGA